MVRVRWRAILKPTTTRGRARGWPLSLLVTLFILFIPGPPLLALSPSRSVEQFHHTAWTIEDGAPADIWALAQTPDGYLWLGTGEGLYQFDGVRFEPFHAAGERPPASNINALVASSNGDLWIGYSTGAVSRLRAGRLTNFKPLRGRAEVNTLAEAPDGSVWAALDGAEGGGLARFDGARWQVFGPALGVDAGPVWGLVASLDGTIWATTSERLIALRPRTIRFAPVGAPLGDRTRIGQDHDGRIWVFRGPHGPYPLPATGPAATTHIQGADRSTGLTLRRAVFDRDGALWASEALGGVIRIAASRAVPAGRADRASDVERFSTEQRLSSAVATPVLEDREGDIWVGTNMGLDRFRSANAVSETRLPVSSLKAFEAAFIGADLLVATSEALYRWNAGGKLRRVASLPGAPTFLYIDRSGVAWLGLTDRLLRYDRGRLASERLPLQNAGRLLSCVQLRSGAIRVSVAGVGVFDREHGRWRRVDLGPGLEAPVQMQTDREGAVWAVGDGRLVRLRGGERRAFSAADGLDVGEIQTLTNVGGELLVGGDLGVARFDGRRFETLSSRRWSVLSRVSGIVEGADGSVWLNGINGVGRLPPGELDAALQDPRRRLRYTLFDLGDGLAGVARQDGNTPTALKGPDGRIWVVTSQGMAWIDPAHLIRNAIPPPVAIRGLKANGHAYAPAAKIRLPAGTSDLEINYTALSFSVPERVRFRYRLEGVDKGWVDPGARREAFYTRLTPGEYTFHVLAANNDGVWNRTGSRISLVVPPTFLQSWVFKAICAASVLAALWLLYSARLRQMGARLRMRQEERVAERERIARELHDTLLQGFQGLVLRFEAVAHAIPRRQAAHALMEQALDRADSVLIEARNRVIDLRSEPREGDLAQLFAATAERLSVEPRLRFRVVAEGAPRRLHPLARDEIGRIFEEALANVLQHGRATSAEASVSYLRRELRVALRDEGVGIDPAVLTAGGRRGHFGLTGMRERARRIEAELTVSSRVGAGTQVTLTVPARVAYAPRLSPPWRTALRRWADRRAVGIGLRRAARD